jgi:hypothetical protein
MKVYSFRQFVFTILMSFIMSGVMSLSFLVLDHGFSKSGFLIWPERWLLSAVIALPTGVVSSILIVKVLDLTLKH